MGGFLASVGVVVWLLFVFRPMCLDIQSRLKNKSVEVAK